MRFYVIGITFLFIFCGISSCSNSEESEGNEPSMINDAEGVLVIDGSPWTFERYELREVRDRAGSDLTDAELIAAVTDTFKDVVIEFMADGRGTETGFDNIPSTFFWKLNTLGRVVFLDQAGNEITPFGSFDVDVQRQRISFTFETLTPDADLMVEVVHFGTVHFVGSF